MRVIDAAAVDAALDERSLVEALRVAFAGDVTVPVRHHHTIPVAGGADATNLLMPAWTNASPRFLGVKVVNVFPDNGKRGLPAVYGTYLLMSGETGETLAAIDGTRLTQWRTAAASALASQSLSRPDSSRLLMVGAGALAPFLVRAHASVRPIREVVLWNHRPERAGSLAKELAADGALTVRVERDLEAAVGDADIVSCATLSTQPLVRGAWLRPGTHVDLVGGFTPAMREADDDAIKRACVFVDTRGGALKEAGDIVQPLLSGVLREADVRADLFELSRGAAGRSGDEQITLFKSVGTAIEDLAAAMLVWSKA